MDIYLSLRNFIQTAYCGKLIKGQPVKLANLNVPVSLSTFFHNLCRLRSIMTLYKIVTHISKEKAHNKR